MATTNLKSCKYKCKLDSTRTYCLGCLRTLEEIAERGKITKERFADGESSSSSIHISTNQSMVTKTMGNKCSNQ